MAGASSIAATGRSIERYLNHCFAQGQPIEGRNTTARLVRTEDLEAGISEPALSLYLFKVDIARAMRAAWAGVGHLEGRARLPLELHFLITAWAENADFEQRILGRALECLETTPILTGPLLDPLGGWAPGEAVQLCLEDLTTEDIMRTFDSLPVDRVSRQSWTTSWGAQSVRGSSRGPARMGLSSRACTARPMMRYS